MDRVEDYVEHEIVPPAELQQQYFSLLKERKAAEKTGKEGVLNEAIAAMNKLKAWWDKTYAAKTSTAKNSPEVMEVSSSFNSNSGRARSRSADTMSERARRNGGLDFDMYSNDRMDSSRGNRYRRPAGYNMSANARANNFTAGVVAGDVDILQGYVGSVTTPRLMKLPKNRPLSNEEPRIELNEWKPDATYLNTLEQTPEKERKDKYLSLKGQYSNQPSFFVDVARFFVEKNETRLALQVLSNVAEMKLEDAGLMRIVAHQLMDMNEPALSILAFREILKMREEDPQSYRDLALAYNETGEYDQAIELLYKLITGHWDGRFGDVKAIALNEMNAIISSHPETAKTNNIDTRLIYAMPVDVRIVISWNTDNSDVDLWVTDPRNEKCFYSHTQTEIGGKISKDVTQGYGPEEFCLKKAWDGNYKVDVNLYGDQRQTLGGPIAIKADMYTDFGKPTQKRKTINLRVTTNKEIVNIGSLKFGS